MEELYVNNQRIDVFKNSVAQTLQVNNLGELKDRQANYTNRIKLPRTPNNIKVFDYLGIPGATSRKPYERVSVKYIVDGIELISDGYGVINQTSGTYNITIYSGNLSLFDAIKELLLSDLNFQDLNHQFVETAFTESLDNTEGYIYALADFGFTEVDPRVEASRIAPSLFKHTLLRKIFDAAGFTYSGPIFENVDFLTEVVPPQFGYEVLQTFSQTSNGNIDSNTISFDEDGLEFNTFFEEIFQPSIVDPLTDLSLVDNYIESAFDGAVRIGGSVSETINEGTGVFEILINGNVIATKVLDPILSGSFQYEVAINQGDRIQFRLKVETEESGGTYQVDISASFAASFNRLQGGNYMDFKTLVPEMKQIDFVKDIMQRYGLMFEARSQTHYEFIFIEDLLNDREGAEDWTDKLTGQGTDKYKIGNYAQSNVATYNYEDDVIPFLNGTMEVQSEILAQERTIFSSPYTISNESDLTVNTQTMYKVPIWVPEYDDNDVLESLENAEDVPRIFRINRVTMTLLAQVYNGANPFDVIGDIPFLSLVDLSMDYYLTRYYKAFKRLLDAPILKTETVLLNPIDIHNFDFFKLKYFEQFGNYYYVNKVSNFRSGKVTKVDLVQANGLTINLPPDQLGTKTINILNGQSQVIELSDFIETNPVYSDPEFDQPETIKIISFGSLQVKMYNNGLLIDSETILDANDLNLTIVDNGQTVPEHTAEFQFKIQSFNSDDFSTVTGKIRVIVAEDVNQPPVASSNANTILVYESDTAGEFTNTQTGSGSDPDGDVLTYLWEPGNTPSFVSFTIDPLDPRKVTLGIFADDGTNHGYTFSIFFTVTDPEGLSDTSETVVEIADLNQI